MAEHVHDKHGGYLRFDKHDDGTMSVRAHSTGVTNGEPYEAWVHGVDPEAIIAAVRTAAGLSAPDDCPGPVLQAVAEQIRSGKLEIDGPADAAIENTVEDSPRYVHTTPATAEEPRLWAGTDEPVIDSLIGRVADLEDEKERTEAHEHLSEHWERRLKVVEQSLTLIPTPGKRGGILAAFAGEDVPQSDRVEKALKIARFAADEDRDIPGVDR